MGISHLSYTEARKKYNSFLTIAYQHVKELNIKNIPKYFDLRHIDERALDIWERIWKPHYKKVHPADGIGGNFFDGTEKKRLNTLT